MFDIEAHLTRQIFSKPRPRPTLIFPEGDDARVIQAAARLLKVANVVLVAPAEAVRATAEREGLRLEGNLERLLLRARCLSPAEEPELLTEFAEELALVSAGKRWQLSLQAAAERVREPVWFSLLAVRLGYADAVVGGVRTTTRDFFLPCLRVLPRRSTVYEMALLALPDRHEGGTYRRNLVAFADVAVTPVPSGEALADIAVGACRSMRDLVPPDVLPEINGAIISYSTKGSGSGASVDRIRAAEALIPERLRALAATDARYASINIETELQISVAISEVAARAKLKGRLEDHPAAGHANVIIVPNLDVGNLLYHIYATRYPEAARCMVVGGLASRVVDLSRNSDPSDVVHASLALVLRLHRSEGYRRTPRDRFFPLHRLLTVNTARDSTHVALWEGTLERLELLLPHTPTGDGPRADARRRLGVVQAALAERNVRCEDLRAVVGRGGLLRPLEGGTYAIDPAMLADLEQEVGGAHPSNEAGLLAHALAEQGGCAGLVVDPVVVDELDPAFRITGIPGLQRSAAWHSLPQKAVAKRYAEEQGRDYAELTLVVAHLAAGISVGAHVRGRVVAVNHALYAGPLSLERAGELPTDLLLRRLDELGGDSARLRAELTTRSGLVALLGDTDLPGAYRRAAAGDEPTRQTLRAFERSVAAEIFSRLAWLEGARPDAVLLTGELTLCAPLVAALRRLLEDQGLTVAVYPGAQEMVALRDGALRVLKRVEVLKDYREAVVRHAAEPR